MSNASTDTARKYLEAAEDCDQHPGRGMCIALGIESKEASFQPKNMTSVWGTQWGGRLAGEKYWAQVTNCRVIALCFMAAMVEAGDA